ncbi:PREDICTED: protein-lysine N-methyltransferase EEF2KMT isoform X3 [Nelumbo nucifera]|uniref:Protein-lysine N-methyltransferase EEF2KMT isoform X3 n=1 Tax=Nelumbo nucifera TaxID=4432 RepID=A0A1U8A3I8_NELNU|nr:PREDICTED: protein-lysine N-methyltransferase EEF2KMT isoform X3 [Nelumbo nucifera]
MEEHQGQGLEPSNPACLHLFSAFVAMEPIDCLISLARECGGGSISQEVQSFIWEQCISNAGSRNHPSDSYIKNFLKRVIVDVESNSDNALDELYEQYACYMTSLKDDGSLKVNTKVCKTISFLFPDGSSELLSCPRSMKIVVPLLCSLNMLEGDTGCAIWPSSLFLSEFILSYPEIFSSKSCFEVGSGVGLVGIALTHAKASKVILSDGDLSSLANMKLNLEFYQLSTEKEMRQSQYQNFISWVECKHLPWESSTERELQDFMPDIVLGADVIYDPICLPHLIRVLSILLNPSKSVAADCDNCQGFDTQVAAAHNHVPNTKSQPNTTKHPVAYLATVIRNVDTFTCFLRLAAEAHLSVVDVTETWQPLNLLPYMQSYNRSSIRLFIISFS